MSFVSLTFWVWRTSEGQWNIKLQSSYFIYEHDRWNWNVLNVQGFSLFNVLSRTDVGRSYFLVIQLSFMIASSVHKWIWRFKVIRLCSIEVWFLPSLINVLRYNLLIRDFVKTNLSQTLTDNLYWLWFFYSKDTVQTWRSDKFAMINLFHTTDLFQSPLRTSENQIFSDVFRSIETDQWHEMG